MVLCFIWFSVPSVLWHCWLGHLTRKNPSPYDLYCVGGTLSLTQSINHHYFWMVMCLFPEKLTFAGIVLSCILTGVGSEPCSFHLCDCSDFRWQRRTSCSVTVTTVLFAGRRWSRLGNCRADISSTSTIWFVMYGCYCSCKTNAFH